MTLWEMTYTYLKNSMNWSYGENINCSKCLKMGTICDLIGFFTWTSPILLRHLYIKKSQYIQYSIMTWLSHLRQPNPFPNQWFRLVFLRSHYDIHHDFLCYTGISICDFAHDFDIFGFSKILYCDIKTIKKIIFCQ